MRVESDLLLLGASLVEGLVRVQVTALRVEVSQGDLRSEKNISGLVSNKSGVLQGVLELGDMKEAPSPVLTRHRKCTANIAT